MVVFLEKCHADGTQCSKRSAVSPLREGYRGLQRVEALIGKGELRNYAQLADVLGVSESRIKYLIFRKERLAESKARNLNRKASKKVELVARSCDSLSFEISLPDDWRMQAPHTFAEELHEIENLRGEFKKLDYNIDREFLAKTMLAWSERLGEAPSEISIVTAEQSELLAMTTIEVYKVNFSKPVSALDFYNQDKLPAEEVRWGNRPGRVAKVDNMETVKYYYCQDRGSPKVCNLYMVEGNIGWLVSAFCKLDHFEDYKFIFERIQKSFRRL